MVALKWTAKSRTWSECPSLSCKGDNTEVIFKSTETFLSRHPEAPILVHGYGNIINYISLGTPSYLSGSCLGCALSATVRYKLSGNQLSVEDVGDWENAVRVRPKHKAHSGSVSSAKHLDGNAHANQQGLLPWSLNLHYVCACLPFKSTHLTAVSVNLFTHNTLS